MLDSLTLAGGRLSEAQKAQYWDQGFLFPIRAIPEDETAALRAEFEALEREWLDNGLPQPLNTYKRLNAHTVMPMVARTARDARVLDVVEGVLGPDIMIYSAEFFIKEPRTKHIVSMHQDLTYWGLGAIDGLVTAWLALSPATVESGCMDFVRASHKNAIQPHQDTYAEDNLLSRGQEIEVDVAPEDKVNIALRPGEMSLHHGLTIHGSGPNASDDRRIGMVIRYIRPDMAQEEGHEDHAMLARGADRHGNFTPVAPPRENFAPEAVALHERIRLQQAAVMMKGAKSGSAAGMYD
ncbi:phytanoyl-CoA dioxygenase family protein [Candidatus Rhodobacter oscarellae]|uniref:Phytanoyl-CoA dioxygenase family protein n=1 Tax=Candidatus Rhodobacter oscarellae TaxID=1675527 RepID=A0A0J9E6T2_9RHOB|nr:phytanoyl-CoA dioxygenase family protein [Candidatus Rhodobacter lobularis]KMW58402.1 phytanoyl-CoA dioxygenase family protein [Candidatus Rhodobacter lobularis]